MAILDINEIRAILPHRYPDFLYRCYMESEPYESLPSANFQFTLYASGEYSRMLETEWGGDDVA